jgi:hypothetical protein
VRVVVVIHADRSRDASERDVAKACLTTCYTVSVSLILQLAPYFAHVRGRDGVLKGYRGRRHCGSCAAELTVNHMHATARHVILKGNAFDLTVDPTPSDFS